MSIKLIKSYQNYEHTKSPAINLAQKRVIGAVKSLNKVGDDVIARRLLEQNIWSQK